MKHVIVISTCDEPDGDPIRERLEKRLASEVEGIVECLHGPCYVQTIFNRESAIAAVKELFHVE